MKQKTLLLIIAICMAMVARPQTLTSNVNLVSQKTEKVFGFKGKMAVIKTRTTTTFAYQRVDTIAVGELVASGDADYGPLYDTRVRESIEASFPIKGIGLAGHYDTSDYHKAFANPGEVVFTDEVDSTTVLKNSFFDKDIIHKRYGISFDQNGFVLDIDESIKTQSMLFDMLLILLSPSAIFIFVLIGILVIAFKKENIVSFYKSTNKLNKYKVCFLLSCVLNLFWGAIFAGVFKLDDNDVIILIPAWWRIMLVVLRLCLTFVITLVASNGIKRFALRGVDPALAQG